MQIFLVIDSNKESYEDHYQYNVAAFDSLDKANNFVNKAQKEYNETWQKNQDTYNKYKEEETSLFKAIPWDDSIDNQLNNVDNEDIERAIYSYLNNKYPNWTEDCEGKHSFFVSRPVPFNP